MPCPIFHTLINSTVTSITSTDAMNAISTVGTSSLLVAAAEFGDKSQMVAMALASRHRHWPIFWGATCAFALLNAMAVLFGSLASHWLPQPLMALLVGCLFLGFGIRYLLDGGEDHEAPPKEKRGHGVFVTTFLMIFLAELGDKTQFAVAGLGAAEPPVWVWIGSTLGLSLTSGLGVWAGKMLYRRISARLINRGAGLLFILFAAVALREALDPDGIQQILSFLHLRT